MPQVYLFKQTRRLKKISNGKVVSSDPPYYDNMDMLTYRIILCLAQIIAPIYLSDPVDNNYGSEI